MVPAKSPRWTSRLGVNWASTTIVGAATAGFVSLRREEKLSLSKRSARAWVPSARPLEWKGIPLPRPAEGHPAPPKRLLIPVPPPVCQVKVAKPT
jgi:hypothetical protein